MAAGPVTQGKVEEQAAGGRAAVGAHEQVALFEQLEVAAHGSLRDAEARCEVGDRHRTALGELVQYQTEAFFLPHGP